MSLKKSAAKAPEATTQASAIGLLERLRARGWQLTPQRRVVAEVLAEEHAHLEADDIHQKAVLRLPEVSRATVYKTLAELVELGEIRQTALGDRAKRYDANVDQAHQHLLCQRCGLVRDVHPTADELPHLSRAQQHGFALTGIDIVFRGLCPDCRELSPQRKSTSRRTA